MLQKFDERNRDLLVNINGRLVHRDQAGVSPFDSAVQGGDAVWEGLRLYDGRIFKLTRAPRPAAQLGAGAGVRRDPVARAASPSEIRRTLAANKMRDGVHIRLTLTRGVKVTSGMDPRLNQRRPDADRPRRAQAAGLRQVGGITLITSSVRRFPPDCLDPKIHHNNLIQSILAKIEANRRRRRRRGDARPRGFVAETNATHLFLVDRGGTVVTPTTKACPEGITRATVLEPVPRERHPLRGARREPRPSSTGPTRCSAPARWASSSR